ncbi:MAG: tetratricopeptide repeat protein [Thermoguttaceae bacterium]
MRKCSWLAGSAVVAGAMCVAAVLGVVGLDGQLFWDDEATTAIYARNLVKQHKITAFDGTNLVGYAYGGGLGEDLGQELRVPPLTACWAAMGMLIFGQTTFAARIMFVVAGVVSLPIMAVWLRRHFGRRFPWYLPPVVLALSPAYLLYIRNCRYYALAVMFTLLVWAFWAPGRSRRGGDPLDGRCLWRYAGGALSLVALMATYYVGAAVVLIGLPLFFIHGRYRQPRQYIMLAAMLLAAVAYGGWILVTVNPFSASYGGGQWSFGGHFARASWHLWMLVRDLGTHEFFPWLLVLPLLLPWCWRKLKRVRPLALRGLVLVVLALLYATVAALLTPSDMGKGEVAEMRYMVPVMTIGAALAGVSLLVLWRCWRPAAPLALVLLVFSNTLHLGFFGQRLDGGRSWWPPTLYRYVYEITHEQTTGNESLIALLRDLPPGTTVSVWPKELSYLVYPAMFYVPELHYCDQLTEKKPIAAELLPLPGYLYTERSMPDVVLVPAPFVGATLAGLSRRHQGEVYRLRKMLSEYWEPTNKPEIPKHFFAAPAAEVERFPAMMVLVRAGTPAAESKCLKTLAADAEGFYQLAVQLYEGGWRGKAHDHFRRAIALNPYHDRAHVALGRLLESLGNPVGARQQYHVALEIDPNDAKAHFNLGNMAMVEEGGSKRAIEHFKEAIRCDPSYAPAHVNLGVVLGASGRSDEAMVRYRIALKLDPELYQAHVQLGNLLQTLGYDNEAIAEYRAALELLPKGSPAARLVEQMLKEAGAAE